MGETEINITYETLFELLRREKGREEIQKLNDSFFKDVADYLNDKMAILEQRKPDLSLISEKDKIQQQLKNTKKILNELYERREKKIINMALNKSRTASEIITASNLLNEEKIFFNELLGFLNKYRDSIITRLMQAKTPLIGEIAKLHDEIEKEETHFKDADVVLKEQTDKKKVRITTNVAQFISPDLEEFGPFEEEDTTLLPKEVAELLVKEGKAKEI